MITTARPSASDAAAANGQIMNREFKPYVYDGQVYSATLRMQLDEARARRIPMVAVLAMLTPATATFQQWQTAEIAAVAQALRAAHGA
jgi:zinc/manganese transport system substrate-binding protein